MKLMLLIIPTIQKTVNPTAIDAGEPDDRRPPNGFAMKSMVIPSATAHSAEADLAGELPAGAQVEQVVERAERRGHGAADEQGAASSARRSGPGTRDELGRLR